MDKKAIEQSIKSSWAAEGLFISAEAQKIGEKFLDGTMTSEEANKALEQKHIREGLIKDAKE